MKKSELLDIISELIVNNSNIGAEEDDEILLDGLEEVMTNVDASGDVADVTLLFTDGKTMKLTVEES